MQHDFTDDDREWLELDGLGGFASGTVSGLGQVSEIADAEPPFTPRGCSFQAWSVGEMLRERAMANRSTGNHPRKHAD